MDNLNFDWPLGFGMKSLVEEGTIASGLYHRLRVLEIRRMKFQASNKLKSLQISFVYLILTSVGPPMSNPN
jgi:hypothetical protein